VTQSLAGNRRCIRLDCSPLSNHWLCSSLTAPPAISARAKTWPGNLYHCLDATRRFARAGKTAFVDVPDLTQLTYDALLKQGRNPVTKRTAGRDPGIARPEPLPSDYTISREEWPSLWRSIERIPESYANRRSYIANIIRRKVAAVSGLERRHCETAVVSRRKLLHEQVLAFVEGAFGRTSPGKAFYDWRARGLARVHSFSQAAAVGVTAAKGGATAQAAAASGCSARF